MKNHLENKTTLQNRADAIAVWKGLNVMTFIAKIYVWYKVAIIELRRIGMLWR